MLPGQVLLAALAFAHAAPHDTTIRLQGLLAPQVAGHAIANTRAAVKAFGPPAATGCDERWPSLGLEVDTCGLGVAITATAVRWHTAAGLHVGDTAQRAHALYPNGRALDFLQKGRLWQLETGGAMCDGGPKLALAAKLSVGRVAALEIVRVPACG